MSRPAATAAWLAIALLLPVGLTVAAGAADKGPVECAIDTNGKDKKVPRFTHLKHAEMPDLGCLKCHHTAKPGETPKRCGACHIKAKQRNPENDARGFKDAFHEQCRKCHKSYKDRPELKKCKCCHGE